MNPVIYVLLSTYNGDKWLKELINSLESQCGVDLKLVIRDDCSDYPTDFSSNRIEITICDHIKTNIGPSESFIHLLTHVPEGEFAAFCDQDDFWEPGRLLEGYLSLQGITGPAVSSSQIRTIDSEKVWPKKRTKLSFGNSLYENLMIGCTMTLNPAAVKLLLEIKPPKGILHDEWAYTLISYVGNVVFVSKVLVNYRIHNQNHSGINALFIFSLGTQIRRIRKWRSQYIYKIMKARYLYDLNLEVDQKRKSILTNYIESNKNRRKMLKHLIRFRIQRSSSFEAIIYGIMTLFSPKQK